MHGGTFRIAHGRMSQSGVYSNTAANALIKVFWHYNKKRWDIESLHEFTDGIPLRADVSGIIRDFLGDEYDEKLIYIKSLLFHRSMRLASDQKLVSRQA